MPDTTEIPGLYHQVFNSTYEHQFCFFHSNVLDDSVLLGRTELLVIDNQKDLKALMFSGPDDLQEGI